MSLLGADMVIQEAIKQSGDPAHGVVTSVLIGYSSFMGAIFYTLYRTGIANEDFVMNNPELQFTISEDMAAGGYRVSWRKK